MLEVSLSASNVTSATFSLALAIVFVGIVYCVPYSTVSLPPGHEIVTSSPVQ